MPHHPFTAGETEAQHDDNLNLQSCPPVVSPVSDRRSTYKKSVSLWPFSLRSVGEAGA